MMSRWVLPGVHLVVDATPFTKALGMVILLRSVLDETVAAQRSTAAIIAKGLATSRDTKQFSGELNPSRTLEG
jgi:hypothetical protein